VSPPEIVFAMARGRNGFFIELASGLVVELERLGVRARIAEDEFPEQQRGVVTVLLPPHEFVNLSGVRPVPQLLRRCVLLSAEQPSTTFFKWNLKLARDAGGVLDINRRAVRAYRASGVQAEHLQLGYSAAWDRRDRFDRRDVDVLFVGRATARREAALAGYADVLERFNCRFFLSDNDSSNTEAAANFASGEGKLLLQARSKVLINIHGEDEPYFEWQRIAEAMSSGCAVVSEHSTDFEPLRPGLDFFAGSRSSLGLLAAWLAEDDEERMRLTGSAEARLRSQATLREGAEVLVAAAERVDRLPLHPDRAKFARVATARMRLATGEPTMGRAAPQDPVSVGEHRALRALKRQHQELLSLRRQLTSEALALRRPDRPEPAAIEAGRTSAWQEPGRPDALVSVVIPLYNHEHEVRDALDSVRSSTFDGWEIVVVDDGSTDGSAEAVEAWMREHQASSCVMIRHEVNRGLPVARNTGAAGARGQLLLMLDADNKLRPFGMERLVGALEKDPDAAFSYGILDRVRNDRPVGLVSKFNWEPERLREGNYIDALALIRRRDLAQLGGYSTDPRLYGLEDYDLWARVAESGRHGAFVREFVATYRAGHSSMLSVTGISETDAAAAIIEHAPRLMDGVEILC
jgi:hypothetical protein